jgi:hypothetical protein
MSEFTRGLAADTNGVTGLPLGVETLGAEPLEERIAPWLFGVIGFGAVIGFGGFCGCCCSTS